MKKLFSIIIVICSFLIAACNGGSSSSAGADSTRGISDTGTNFGNSASDNTRNDIDTTIKSNPVGSPTDTSGSIDRKQSRDSIIQ